MPRAALTDPATPLNVQPVGQSGFGDPVFSDEFAGASLDRGKWDPWYPDTPFWNATAPGGHRTNSNEPQGYDESGISFVTVGANKYMRLTFHESNAAVPELDYTSGMVTSYPSFNPVYGYFEARIKVPNADGAWPAFWMDPTDQVWPPEIDWMENWGKASYNLQTSHTFHYPRPTPGGYSDAVHGFANDVGNDFHVFGGLWEPGRLRWYVDGVLVKDLSTSYVPNKGMYLICNLAGSTSNSAWSASAPFSVDVDYIRAWSLDGEDVTETPPEGETMPGLTNAESKATLDARFTTGDYVAYSTNGTSEFAGLARTAITWGTATTADPSVKSNSAAITSAAATSAGTITHTAVYSASTAGTQRTEWQAVTASKTVAIGDTVSLATGQLSITLT